LFIVKVLAVYSLQLVAWLVVTQKTTWHLNHRIKKMLSNYTPELLDEIVEVDEIYVGGVKYPTSM
jgi:hypothetical protein